MKKLFTFTLEEFLGNYQEFVEQFLRIDDCLQNLYDLPQEYACFSQLLLESKLIFERLEASLEYSYGSVRTDLRESKSKLGSKLTDKQLDNLADSVESILEIKQQLQVAKNNYEQMKEFITALNYKKDMLIQISANTRQEKKLYS